MSELDTYFDTFGRRLATARPRRARRAPVMVATGAMATAAVAATLLIGGGPAPIDALGEARAALTVREDQIAVLRMRVDLPGTTATIEQWTATNPRRWRSVRVINGTRMEAAWDGSAQSWLLNDRLSIQEGVPEDDSFGSLPIPLGFDGTHPETDVLALLAAGRLTDQGEVEVGGRKVRRLVGAGLTYDVDPVTFAPLQGSLKDPELVFTVERYAKLPLDAQSAKLLAITPPPGAKIERSTAEELRGDG